MKILPEERQKSLIEVYSINQNQMKYPVDYSEGIPNAMLAGKILTGTGGGIGGGGKLIIPVSAPCTNIAESKTGGIRIMPICVAGDDEDDDGVI
uniref:Uncharacterized protein n=1 Tax=Romanomermis culicivorax TaxID=13658 RepID=A0A915JJ86_ROMCU